MVRTKGGGYIALALARWEVGLPQNLVWQILELLHCLISVPILHFPVASVAAMHTPSLATTDDGTISLAVKAPVLQTEVFQEYVSTP